MYSDVYRELSKGYKDIIIYIDVAGISKGFYSTTTIRYEVAQYANTQELPTIFLQEMQEYLKLLYEKFKQYNPKFVLFHDLGQCQQNVAISSDYKGDRRAATSSQRFMVEEEQMRVFKLLKSYYYESLTEKFQIPNYCYTVDLKEYESDLTPQLIIREGLLGSTNPTTLNLVMALDKDLIQICKFPNVRMAASIYFKAKRRLDMKLLDNENGLEYLYPKFKRGILNAGHLPIILAMSGDKADSIYGLKNVGYAKAIKLATQYFSDIYEFNSQTKWPMELEPYKELLIKNFKMVDFDSQISRLSEQCKQSVRELCV